MLHRSVVVGVCTLTLAALACGGTATVTPTLTASATPPPDIGGQTACDHPYLPLRAGATWLYTTPSGPVTWTITAVTGDQTSATAEMVQTFADKETAFTWQCGAEGLVAASFGFLIPVGVGDWKLKQVTEASGVFLPPADLLTPAYQWSGSAVMVSDFIVEGQALPAVVRRVGQAQVLGAESVTVNGQTLDAVQIEITGSVDIEWQVPNIIPTHIDDTSLASYARGVGMLRWEYTAGGTTVAIDLVDYDVP